MCYSARTQCNNLLLINNNYSVRKMYAKLQKLIHFSVTPKPHHNVHVCFKNFAVHVASKSFVHVLRSVTSKQK